jgi:hypothetical protein
VPRADNPFITPDIGETGQAEINGHQRSAFLLERKRERERGNALPVTGGIKIHALLTRGRFVDPDG